MRYLRAGADQAYIRELAGMDVLISYAEKTQHAFIRERANYGKLRDYGRTPYLMLDNGAFKVWNSGKGQLDVAAYSRFILDNLAGIDHAIAADVIPGRPGVDPTPEEAAEAEAATVANLEAMLAAGVPQGKLLPVVHLKMPNWRQVMRRYIALGFDYVCLGGTVKAKEAEAKAWLQQVFDEFPSALDGRFSASDRQAAEVPARGVFYHLLGLSRKWSKAMPAVSCDSTTWLAMAKKKGAKEKGEVVGIAKNRYIVQKLPGYYYHKMPRLGHLAAVPDDEAEDLGRETLRLLGAISMGVKMTSPPTSWLPARGTPAWFDAVYWLQVFWCWDGEPFNPYRAARNYAEDYAREHFAGWEIPAIAPEEDDLVYGFQPANEQEAEACGYPWPPVGDPHYWQVRATEAPAGAQLALFDPAA